MNGKEQVKPTNPLVEVIGETLERIHAVPSDNPNLKEAGYKSIVLCFGNGKSIHLDAEIYFVGTEGVIPVITSRAGDWEMIEAAPDLNYIDVPVEEEKPPRESVEADLHEIDGANQD